MPQGIYSLHGPSSALRGLSPSLADPHALLAVTTKKQQGKEPQDKLEPRSYLFHHYLRGLFSNPHFPEGHQKHTPGFLKGFCLWKNDLQFL